ncbi:hypothetical protein C6500_04485 [Candidatus Poribacteria bacterium]|nr:MAG: hypothetical protein C6500_04485 [Candidatus Poribacteria bacterium]
MNLFFSVLSIVIAILLTVHIIGCESFNEEEKERPVVVFVSAIPADGKIPADGTITLNFDKTPRDVTVRANTGKIGKTTISTKTVTIIGPFTQGELALTITWADSEQTLNYTVTAPSPSISIDIIDIEEPIDEPEPEPKPQLTQSPFDVTDENFTELVMESELPVVVYFWADWCPPCEWMAPIIKEVASENQETFLIAKLDFDRNLNTVLKYQIKAIPTFIVFRDGKITGRFIGGMQKVGLLQQIRQAMNNQGN